MASLWIGTSKSALHCTTATARVCCSPARRGMAAKAKTPPPAKPVIGAPLSSCPGGTVLSGIQYLKDAPQLIAKEDSEYPPWLWTLLDEPVKAGGQVPTPKKSKKQKKLTAEEEEQLRLQKEEEELKRERKQMRKENRENIRMQNFMKTT